MNAAIEVILAISRVEVERAPPAPSGRQEGARVLQNALSPEHLVQLESQERRDQQSHSRAQQSHSRAQQSHSRALLKGTQSRWLSLPEEQANRPPEA
jgi:hypothetical protein